MKRNKQLPDESVLSRIRKIAALAERGYRGEAVSARRILEAQLEQYGLTLADILSDQKRDREFKFSNKREFRLFLAVFVHHFGSKSEEFKTATVNRRGKLVYASLTDLDFADFAPEWDYYRATLARELRKTEDAFLVAFVNKFDLFDTTPNESDEPAPERSEKDLEQLRRALGLMESIDANPYRKLLGQ